MNTGSLTARHRADRKANYKPTVAKPIILQTSHSFKDLGVVIDEKLTFRDHMHDKINKAYVMLGIIKRNFNYLTISSLVLLYKVW